MSKKDLAKIFERLHIKGNPIILYNVWDAGSAKAIADGGAKAVATSSWAVAAAQGYEDGEELPIEFLEKIVERITSTVEVPVTIDFEGGYGEKDSELTKNLSRILDLGIVGINFEDRVVNGSGLYDIEKQAHRISVLRETAKKKNAGLFINARTDLFLGQGNEPEEVITEALQRAKAYEAAGASGLFIPGLDDPALIQKICKGTNLPVNVMIMDEMPGIDKLAELGVSRISYGPIPYATAMETLKQKAIEASIPPSGFACDADTKAKRRVGQLK